MNNRYSIVLQCAVIGAVYLFPHCTRNVAGGGTEDVNTRIVMGKIYLAGNQPASHALVRLIPDGYDPVTEVDVLLSGCGRVRNDTSYDDIISVYAQDDADSSNCVAGRFSGIPASTA